MNRLKELRSKRGLTTEQLSSYTSIDRTTLSRLENGVRPFTQEHIMILANYFNVTADFLLGIDMNSAPLSISLKEARLKKGLSQIEVAKLINIGNKTISDYERGVSSPDPDTLKKLATIYNISTDFLLGMPNSCKPLSLKLKQARINKGLSQIDVNNLTGINNKTLSNYENNVSLPDPETIKLLAKLYNVSTDHLLGMDETHNLFSERIKELRKQRNITQEELADLVDVGKTTVSAWENGINFPNNKILIKLTDFFNVSSDYLLGISNSNINANFFAVSQRIKSLREKIGKSQGELADLINVKRYTVSDWENERTEPNIESITRLCNIFNVSSDYLLGIETNSNHLELDEFETEVLSYSSKLSENQKKFVLKMLSELSSEENKF